MLGFVWAAPELHTSGSWLQTLQEKQRALSRNSTRLHQHQKLRRSSSAESLKARGGDWSSLGVGLGLGKLLLPAPPTGGF